MGVTFCGCSQNEIRRDNTTSMKVNIKSSENLNNDHEQADNNNLDDILGNKAENLGDNEAESKKKVAVVDNKDSKLREKRKQFKVVKTLCNFDNSEENSQNSNKEQSPAQYKHSKFNNNNAKNAKEDDNPLAGIVIVKQKADN